MQTDGVSPPPLSLLFSFFFSFILLFFVSRIPSLSPLSSFISHFRFCFSPTTSSNIIRCCSTINPIACRIDRIVRLVCHLNVHYAPPIFVSSHSCHHRHLQDQHTKTQLSHPAQWRPPSQPCRSLLPGMCATAHSFILLRDSILTASQLLQLPVRLLLPQRLLLQPLQVEPLRPLDRRRHRHRLLHPHSPVACHPLP